VAGTTDVPKIKGLAFIEALKWYAKTRGQARILEALEATPQRLRVHVTQPDSPTLGLLPGSWYPSELIQTLFVHFCNGLGPREVQQLAADFSKVAIANTLTGMYGTFMRMLVSPDMIASYYQKIWRLYQSTGRCEVIVRSPTCHELRVHEWPAHYHFFCMMVMFGTKSIYEIIGCKNVTSATVACVDQKSPYCAYTLRWER
jgi:hypothetical protein